MGHRWFIFSKNIQLFNIQKINIKNIPVNCRLINNLNNTDLNEIFTSQNILRTTQQVRVLELLQLVSEEVLAADLIFELFEV